MCASQAIGICSPQKHFDQPLVFRVGIRQPVCQMRYFQACQSWLRRQVSKFSSVNVGSSSKPDAFELGARGRVGLGCPTLVCARLGARVEAEMPAPLVDVLWNAGARADRADMHVAKVDVPSFLVRVFATAAGEGGIGHSWKIVDDRAA